LETLDFGKIALIRSYVCEPDRLEPLTAQAEAATSTEQIATILHDDALLIGVFEAFVVYGWTLIWTGNPTTAAECG
jgi:hypothetical protein